MSVYALSVQLACLLDEMWQFTGSCVLLWAAVSVLQFKSPLVREAQPTSRHEPDFIPGHCADAVGSGNSVTGACWRVCCTPQCWCFSAKNTDCIRKGNCVIEAKASCV